MQSLCKNIQLMLVCKAFNSWSDVLARYSNDIPDDFFCNITISGNDNISTLTLIRLAICNDN